MSARRHLRAGLRIGRAEYVRSVRRYVGDARRILGLVVVALCFSWVLLFSIPAGFVFGRTASAVVENPFFGPAATAIPIGLVLLATLRTVERIGSIDAADLVLLTVHPRAIVIGLITAEIARLATWFGLPAIAVVAAFALGLGAPWLVVTGGLVMVPLVCVTAVWGYAVGIAILRALRRVPRARRILHVGWLLAVVGLVVGSQFLARYLVDGGAQVRSIASTLALAPLADYLALAFVGTPLARPMSIGAVGVLFALLALTPVGLAVATRLAAGLWFSDGTREGGTRQTKTVSGGFRPPRPFAWTKSGRIAWGQLVRAVRHPQDLSHLVMILFVAAPLAPTVVGTSGERLGVLLAGTGVGFGTYVAGAAFGLNPLGDDRPQVPLLVLSGTDPRTFVRGRLLAGLAMGAPVAVLVPLATVAIGTDPLDGLAFAAVGIGTCLAAGQFALGIGAAYPIYEERQFWGSETVVPSTLVMMTYSFVVGSGTMIALFVTWFAVTGHLTATVLVAAGLSVYLLLTAGISYGSYRYAIRRYRRYTVD
ncbi:hypothetical protein [Halovivax cerinus]|uniref:ABC-2 type transport system permease protein n=1 Tax=Halovivax cerinus TaxID=1487865 RepID=A0ABD5NN04_9EURY|nr:hypothetical protein [Halovivax cerinus]